MAMAVVVLAAGSSAWAQAQAVDSEATPSPVIRSKATQPSGPTGQPWVADGILYDNGPLATPGSLNGACLPVGGIPSEVQVGNITAGYNSSQIAIAGGFRIADDFVVPAGETWNVTGFRVPTYSTGAAAPTVTGVWIQVWNGPPNAGGAVIAGDLVTNRFASNAWTDLYRFFNATCGTTRRVQDVRANLAVSLGAGTYWVEWSTVGGASGPWAPNVTIEGLQGKPGANALQWTGAAWVAVMENSGLGPAQDMVFLVDGDVAGGCYPDCDGANGLTVADFSCFQTKFVQGDPYADCDGANGLTVADFSCFQTKFVQGCN
jgi:hypothetical protein